MTDKPRQHLSGAELASLNFAAHRQLARWSNKPQLSPNQHAQRNALTRAIRVLQDNAFTDGCEVRSSTDDDA